jgi:hypothetical protein
MDDRMGKVLRGARDRGDGDADPGHTKKRTRRYASELAERSRAAELLSEAENSFLAELENSDITIQLQPALDELNELDRWVHEAIEQNSLLNNIFAGLNSPDPRQRARFRAAMDEHLGELNLVEHASMLRVIERAKKRRGRKVGSKSCTGATPLIKGCVTSRRAIRP